MVISPVAAHGVRGSWCSLAVTVHLPMGAADTKPLIERMGPELRVQVMLLLLALVLLGGVIALVAWAGRRFIWRQIRDPLGPTGQKQQDGWAEKPLMPKDRGISPDGP